MLVFLELQPYTTTQASAARQLLLTAGLVVSDQSGGPLAALRAASKLVEESATQAGLPTARSPRQKGDDGVGPTKRGKGSKLMLLVVGTGPSWPSTSIARKPADVTLIEPLPDSAVTPHVAGRLVYDRAAQS